MIVVLDACVLFPAPHRDFLMHLSVLDVIQARWTDEIHEEWIRNVLSSRPDLSKSRLERTRRLMDLHTRDCLVNGYQHLIESLELPDDDDRHVLAAAIQCGAKTILTFNLRDFPSDSLKPFGIAARSPDNLITGLFRENRKEICLAFSRQLESLKNPSKTKDELLELLASQGLKRTSALLSNCK